MSDEGGPIQEPTGNEPGQAPPPPGPQINPQSGYPVPPQQYPSYPPQPGTSHYPGYVLPDHPKATPSLVVGIVSVAGLFVCGLPVLASPVAWVLGAQARREIRNAPQQWGGESKATTGMVLGIIGTALLVLAVILLAVLIAVVANEPTVFDSDTSV